MVTKMETQSQDFNLNLRNCDKKQEGLLRENEGLLSLIQKLKEELSSILLIKFKIYLFLFFYRQRRCFTKDARRKIKAL